MSTQKIKIIESTDVRISSLYGMKVEIFQRYKLVM